jgi:ribosomal protein S18 acetylase RimI-like enzyme
MADIIIRKFRAEDRETVRNIAWNTAFLGEPASAYFASPQILKDFLTLYFTDYEPESCFVAEAGRQVVGYLIGSKNTSRLEKVFTSKIFWPLLTRAMLRGAFFMPKNISFGIHSLVSFLRGEYNDPEFSAEYPATLHINLDSHWRNHHIGSRLINAYFDYLRSNNVSGVRLGTMSDKAAAFFRQQGFELLYTAKRSYLRYLLNRDIPIYIYGKKL